MSLASLTSIHPDQAREIINDAPVGGRQERAMTVIRLHARTIARPSARR